MEKQALKAIIELGKARTVLARPVTGLALLLLASGTISHLFVVQPAEKRLQLLEKSLAQRRAVSGIIPASTAASKTPAEKLEAFYAFFDRKLSSSEWLARFFDIAERASVDVQQAEYRRVDSEGEPLARYEIALPLTGDYGKIRSFAVGVLNNIPIASLDQITFRRQRANQPGVEADLRFTFYFHPGSR